MSTISDKGLGEIVKMARELRNLSQSAVAAFMRERGHKWSQATVWSVEKGERPLRMRECLDLDSLFGEFLIGAITGQRDGTESFQRGFRQGVASAMRAVSEVAA